MLFITQPRVGTSHNEIIALQMAAREYGWQVISAPTSWRLDNELTSTPQLGIPYGSQTFCEVISQQMGWKLHQNSFDWLAKIPKEYLKRQVDFMSLKEAKKIEVRKFIKPADDKCFDAKIYEPGEFKPHELISDDYPVLVSDVVKWDIEYRCFIGNNETNHNVFTWSNYLFYGQINDPHFHKMIPGDLEHIEDFMKKVLRDSFKRNMIGPSVIDVGVIPRKGWAVIETNPIWASGIYGCDPMQVIMAMNNSVSLL